MCNPGFSSVDVLVQAWSWFQSPARVQFANPQPSTLAKLSTRINPLTRNDPQVKPDPPRAVNMRPTTQPEPSRAVIKHTTHSLFLPLCHLFLCTTITADSQSIEITAFFCCVCSFRGETHFLCTELAIYISSPFQKISRDLVEPFWGNPTKSSP